MWKAFYLFFLKPVVRFLWEMCFLFLFQTTSVWKPLITISTHKIVKAWLVWQPNTAFLAKLQQLSTFQRCLFFSHALPISLNTLTLELSLFQCVASWVPDSQAWDPEDAIPGFGRFEGFWHGYLSWKFPRATSVPGCHTSGGTEEHCGPAPTFRGLLRGTTEENTECHCYIAPMICSVSCAMMSWQSFVQLWPSTHVW